MEEANLPLHDDEKCNYWWLNANPKIWSFSDIAVGETQAYTLYNENGNKRRIFQNFLDAKVGDVVIGYESNPVRQIVAIGRVSAEQDGEKLFLRKLKHYPLQLITPCSKNARNWRIWSISEIRRVASLN